MSCARFELDLLDAARGVAMPTEAAAHVDGCARCAAWLDDQRALSGLLGMVATAPVPSAPPLPPALRQHLRASRSEVARAWSPAWLAVPVAAAVAWILLTPPPGPPVAAALPTETTAQAPVPSATATPAPGPEATPRPVPAQVPRRVRAPRPAPERATHFVRVPYSGAWGAADGLQLVRVQMPRAALVRYGWPAVSDTQPVTADILMGADGMAHAIRLVESGSE